MLEDIIEIARQAGEICVREYGRMQDGDIEFKNDKDLVTVVDKNVEQFIVEQITRRYPDHDIFGEESGRTTHGSDYCWIIDPIDGTTSFVHGQPWYCTSIALHRNGEAVLGVVHSPRLGETYHAEKGKGAYLNGRQIKVSQRTRLIESVLATGFACIRAGWEDNNLKHLNVILPQIRDIRRCGSAAIDLCFVAAGRLEGYWEMGLQPYDYAAGELIVREAGGVVSDFAGGNEYGSNGIMATNGLITEALQQFF
ncbi:inositol monophosphatase family protein [Desulfogranum japonicum]|uniref:inositol monophosphatase family protein n=1 Tax=Desulfogranum japonicum TaxID=231447 RepID=UPI00040FA2AC|nr:inositol monophosphatase family protein [Desulfogranum japonicum]